MCVYIGLHVCEQVCIHMDVYNTDINMLSQLTCWGQIRHKLQVQATKEVYERTKKLMKETEEQKQKNKYVYA